VSDQLSALRVVRPPSLSSAENGVALCFKVPLRFRQWLKLQALSRNVTMTEILIKAAEYYSTSEPEAAVWSAINTDLQK
jgi:hypothetical protein